MSCNIKILVVVVVKIDDNYVIIWIMYINYKMYKINMYLLFIYDFYMIYIICICLYVLLIDLKYIFVFIIDELKKWKMLIFLNKYKNNRYVFLVVY